MKKIQNILIAGTINEFLVVSSCFSLLLLIIRIVFSGTFTYVFLPWNLFLAFIPFWIGRWIYSNSVKVKKWYRLFPVLIGWILFMPNTFYIITDLFHLNLNTTVPKWFDLLMIFSFAWNGILCGILSLTQVEQVFKRFQLRKLSVVIIFFVMWLCAFGIYIGRYLRFNSWDVIFDPLSLISEISYLIIHPFRNYQAWGMVLLYSVFMTFLYLTIKKLSEALNKMKLT